MNIDQEDLQFLGMFGILRESLRIISSKINIFSKITLAFILPLSIILLAHFIVFQIFLYGFLSRVQDFPLFPKGNPDHDRITHEVYTQFILFWLSNAAFFTLLLLLSLLSTSAVVYTIACLYTSKEITFNKVLSVITKVWKRLTLTFIWGFAIIFVYNLVADLIMYPILGQADFWSPRKFFAILMSLLVLYFIGFVCVGTIWYLATVVSVMENSSGIKAMIKSKDLIKGKMGFSVCFSIVISFCFLALLVLFEISFVGGVLVIVPIAFLCLLLLSMVILIGLVIQTVFYFVCKSYHHENIDKSSLANHLEEYLGEYVPLYEKDVQLEEVKV